MHHLNDVSLAGRWWPVLAAGYRFHRNTGTDPRPILKKNINKRQNFGPGDPPMKLSVSAQVYSNKYGKIMRQTRH